MKLYTNDMLQRVSDAETNLSSICAIDNGNVIATISDKTYGINTIDAVKVYPLDANSEKLVEIFTYDIDNKRIKITKRLKVTTVRTMVNRNVARRRNISRFGDCKNVIGAEQGVTMSCNDDVKLQITCYGKEPEQQSDSEPRIVGITCRNCHGQHLTVRCPHRDIRELERSATTISSTPEPPRSNVYVPPAMRTGGAGISSSGVDGFKKRNRENNLKITNISTDTTDDDLYTFVCNEVRKPQRIHIVRDRQTNVSKGYAFIQFYNSDDYQYALNTLNGKRLDYCVITVEAAS